MEFCALASGSSGNCFYISDKDTAVLVDAGMSAKKILERMDLLSLDVSKVKGILLTHEHLDHILGADVLARKLNVPIYATKEILKKTKVCKDKSLIVKIDNDSEFFLENLKISVFPRSHSAADPVSYLISDGNKKVSVITDIGYACEHTIKAVKDSDAIFLESNHDVKMLESGPYLPFHKKWVLSDEGHLSNMQAALLILEHANPKLQRIVLSHLSKVNNTPELAHKTMHSLIKERSDINPKISISTREFPTELFKI